jgi:glutamyl-tRNA reductase
MCDYASSRLCRIHIHGESNIDQDELPQETNSMNKPNFRVQNIGFIGLGIMGSRMAANLQKHDYQLVVFNRTRVKGGKG